MQIDVRLDDADGVFSVRNTKQLSDGSVNASKDSKNFTKFGYSNCT